MDNTGIYTHFIGYQKELVNPHFTHSPAMIQSPSYPTPISNTSVMLDVCTGSSSNTPQGSEGQPATGEQFIRAQDAREKQYQLFADTASNLIHIVSLRGVLLYISPLACKRQLEYNPEELTGKSISAFIQEQDFAYAMRQLRNAVDGAVISYMCRVNRKNAGQVYIDVRGHVM